MIGYFSSGCAVVISWVNKRGLAALFLAQISAFYPYKWNRSSWPRRRRCNPPTDSSSQHTAPTRLGRQLRRRDVSSSRKIDMPATVRLEENQAAEATPTAMQHDAPIEALPAEIRRQILLSLDVEELRTLVRASPVFHQQYRLDRRFILYHRLESSLGRAVVEACVLHRATAIGSLPPNAPGRTEAIRHFGVETWPARCSDAPYSVAGGGFTADEVGSMVLFHSTVIRPIAQEYATWALELLSKQTQRDRPQIPLSRYEETRVARALYRIQLICFLWGSASDNPGWAYAARLSPKDLFQSIEPWEIEEMVCIYIFLHLTYDKTFIAIRWELHPDLAGECKPESIARSKPSTPSI